MNFLMCVGAEKAGTTWLYEYFKSHPEYHDIGKELNIIQRDDLVPCLEDVDEYRKNIETFFQKVSLSNSVTGDFTHYEGSSENVFRIIKDGLLKYDIEVVPVYIMRDPIKRAWSAWNMLGGGSSRMPRGARFLVENYLSCKYKETVQALDNVFENPLYFFYEDFFQQDNIDMICSALNISHAEADFNKIINGGIKKKPSKAFVKKFGKSKKTIEAVKFISERFDNVPWKLQDYT